MDTFYDGDLKDIWDSDLDPTESLKITTDTDMHDWFLERDIKDPAVILNDKLISDALLNGTLPIKTEHSYSLNSDGDSLPDSPRSLQTKMDDMEDECYPAISLKTATSNLHHTEIPTIDPKCLTITSSPAVTLSCNPLAISSNITTTTTNGLSTISSCATPATTLHNNNSHTSTLNFCSSDTNIGGNISHNHSHSHSHSHSHNSNNNNNNNNCNNNNNNNNNSINSHNNSPCTIYAGLNKMTSAPMTFNLRTLENSCAGTKQQNLTLQSLQQKLLLPHKLSTAMVTDDDCGSNASSRDGSTSPDICSDIEIDEAFIKDEPISPDSSCPPSPNSQATTNGTISLNMANMAAFTNSDLVFEHKNGCLQLTPASQNLLKSQHLLLSSSTTNQNIIIPKSNIKTESNIIANGTYTLSNSTKNNNNNYGLPLTPPSSLPSDDSEGNLTPEHLLSPLSPNTSAVSINVIGHNAQQTLNASVVATSSSSSSTLMRRNTNNSSSSTSSSSSSSNNGRNVNGGGGSSRQPIHTPLISSQPKGSTGTLILTEEEKRTLLAEGYPIPQKLPLTKAEEKSLKKIRRKIKNKISAQESRRKKKEYMDQLERKVEILVNENNDYRLRVESLEDTNANLLSQLHKLQALVNKQNLKK